MRRNLIIIGSLSFFSASFSYADPIELDSVNKGDISVSNSYDGLDISHAADGITLSISAAGADSTVAASITTGLGPSHARGLVLKNISINNENSGSVSATGSFSNVKGLSGAGESTLSISATGSMSAITAR